MHCQQGVCNHGDTTSNDAEATFKMMAHMRDADDLFTSLLTLFNLERARTISLLEEVEKVKASIGKKLGEEWGGGAAVPAIEWAHQQLRAAASTLPQPTSVLQTESLNDADQFYMQSSSSGAIGGTSMGGAAFKWRVIMSKMQQRKYEEVCGCGRLASDAVGCKHFKRVLISTVTSWRNVVKPWQQPDAWERQHGPIFDPITGQDVMDATDELFATGQLRYLVQPSLEIKNKGRPKDDANLSVEATARAKSFLEEMKDFGDPKAALKQVLAGNSKSGRNAGGKGTAKTCSFCKAAGRQGTGHRANKCPFRYENEGEELKADAAAAEEEAELSVATVEEEEDLIAATAAEEEVMELMATAEKELMADAATNKGGKVKEGKAKGGKYGEVPESASKQWVKKSDGRLSGHVLPTPTRQPAASASKCGVWRGRRGRSEEWEDQEWRELMEGVHELGGDRRASSADGWCWFYSVLGAFGLLQQPSKPTPQDFEVCAVVLDDLKRLASSHCEWLTLQERRPPAHMPTCPSW